MNLYLVHHGYSIDPETKIYRRRAESAVDAIEKIADQYNWGRVHIDMVDADTRGEEYCEASVGWSGNCEHFLVAEKEK